MTDYLSALLGALLVRAILVGAVLVAMRFLWAGQYALTAALVLPLLVFLYLVGTDAALLE
ncbi:hypothetical protein ACFQJD_10150 [Haloplanus sp. GCM10025708]|uniref:hypothetical protein n=1 Tax=Haloferacaceae TaxID=1644056 RepID=UPI003614D286